MKKYILLGLGGQCADRTGDDSGENFQVLYSGEANDRDGFIELVKEERQPDGDLYWANLDMEEFRIVEVVPEKGLTYGANPYYRDDFDLEYD